MALVFMLLINFNSIKVQLKRNGLGISSYFFY